MSNNIDKALVGKLYLKSSNAPVVGYFECLKLIRPLLDRFDVSNAIPGFYINISSGKRHVDAVRLTYFAFDPKETKNEIDIFLGKNSHVQSLPVEDFDDAKYKEPIEASIAITGVDEKRDRVFANTYTHIGLDLLANFGELCTRRLIATYRLEHFPLLFAQPFFEVIFSKHSEFFRQLRDDYPKESLWDDLSLFNHKRIHMFVNMLLPGDVHGDLSPYGQAAPKVIKEQFLREIRLDLPQGWEANC